MASVYPGALPTNSNKTNKVDLVNAADVNKLQDDTVAIATELGTDPAGSCTDVKTRLAVCLGANGAVNLAGELTGTGVEGQLLLVGHVPYFWNGSAWALFAQTRIQLFTANGTFTAPTGITTVYVTRCAGGGGGGANNAGTGSGGGGGGAYGVMAPYTVVAGNNYDVVVGAGGTTGVAGGNSTFDGTLSVTGGALGGLSNGGAGGTVTAQDKVGGAGSGATGGIKGYITYAGGAGANYAVNSGGGGGGSLTGVGGNGGTDTNNGSAGTGYGAGGGGAGRNGTVGGSGVAGFVLVEW